MSYNGSSVMISPVVQGKEQTDIMNNMQNHNIGNSTSVPVSGSCFNGTSFLSGNSVNAPPPPQMPTYSITGIRGNATF
ncbi:hypothetical protein OsI_38522 [Oryza sativa Indica Group]|uniref:Uncharacterized protein n=5 Tax=Oryza TaxID=4527 RepID=A0A0D3HV23_9ORYZ|nr:uncharacterized protein LOC127757637 [Oryza glaberrima]EEC69382.1 hypothetical protein OsI_38522 [Oryza sativa Indica Group]